MDSDTRETFEVFCFRINVLIAPPGKGSSLFSLIFRLWEAGAESLTTSCPPTRSGGPLGGGPSLLPLSAFIHLGPH